MLLFTAFYLCKFNQHRPFVVCSALKKYEFTSEYLHSECATVKTCFTMGNNYDETEAITLVTLNNIMFVILASGRLKKNKQIRQGFLAIQIVLLGVLAEFSIRCSASACSSLSSSITPPWYHRGHYAFHLSFYLY